MACHSKSNHVIAQATKLRDCIIVKAMQFFFHGLTSQMIFINFILHGVLSIFKIVIDGYVKHANGFWWYKLCTKVIETS